MPQPAAPDLQLVDQAHAEALNHVAQAGSRLAGMLRLAGRPSSATAIRQELHRAVDDAIDLGTLAQLTAARPPRRTWIQTPPTVGGSRLLWADDRGWLNSDTGGE